MKSYNTRHPDLIAAEELAYKPNGLIYDWVAPEAESQEYGACSFEMNNKIIQFRVAKITPKKRGQFVTFWKRIGHGPIMPYDINDSFDLLVISVRDSKSFGQFIFPKSVLWDKGFISKNGIGGKRAMRVYPPWHTVNNTQAKKTQAWQILYFIEFQPNIDDTKIQKIFS